MTNIFLQKIEKLFKEKHFKQIEFEIDLQKLLEKEYSGIVSNNKLLALTKEAARTRNFEVKERNSILTIQS